MRPDSVKRPGGPTAPAVIATTFATVFATVFAIASLIGAAPHFALAQAGVALVQVDVQAVARGYRASKLRGTAVTNDRNEKIGTVDDLILGLDRVVLFAVIQVGGFFGVGSHHVAVPFDSLKIDDTGTKIVLPGATKQQLQGLPEFKYIT
jgi:sporulation protein YlmC with PRC-barrel domain